MLTIRGDVQKRIRADTIDMNTRKLDHAKSTRVSWSDRGRTPRLEVLERIQGELRALDMPVTLLDLSYGGFLMEAPVDFIVGGSHDFRFTAARQALIVLCARVVHSAPTGVATYVMGLEFEEADSAAVQDAVELLLDLLEKSRSSSKLRRWSQLQNLPNGNPLGC
jgi:hypothetical protein